MSDRDKKAYERFIKRLRLTAPTLEGQAAMFKVARSKTIRSESGQCPLEYVTMTSNFVSAAKELGMSSGLRDRVVEAIDTVAPKTRKIRREILEAVGLL